VETIGKSSLNLSLIFFWLEKYGGNNRKKLIFNLSLFARSTLSYSDATSYIQGQKLIDFSDWKHVETMNWRCGVVVITYALITESWV
jgi:hypothetical protein